MSHYSPNGPPPPPYAYPGVPGPPYPYPPQAYTYVPAPTMIPVYPPPAPALAYPPPPPTAAYPEPPSHPPMFVTNHIYSQPPVPTPGPAPIVEEKIDWVPATPTSVTSLSDRAFVAGKEAWNGSPLWVIRAHHSGEFIPGKLAIKTRSAYIPHGGKEIPVHNFEVLCAPEYALRWIPASNGQVPVGALAAGNTHNAEPLYIARVNHSRSVTPGKVHPSHGCCYISYGGAEISYKNYEVLCKIVG